MQSSTQPWLAGQGCNQAETCCRSSVYCACHTGRHRYPFSTLKNRHHTVERTARHTSCRWLWDIGQLWPIGLRQPASGNALLTARIGFYAKGMLRQDDSAPCYYLVLQRFVHLGMRDVQAWSHYNHCLSICIKASPMGGRVASQSQTADDDITLPAYLFGKSISHIQPLLVCRACANNSHIVLTVEQFHIAHTWISGWVSSHK